jgi:Tape measure protein
VAVTINISADSREAQEAFKRLQAEATQAFGTVDRKMAETAQKSSSVAAATEASFKRMADQTRGSTGRMLADMERLQTQWHRMAGAFGATLSVAAVVQLGRSLKDAGLEAERMQRQLMAAVGSAAQRAMAFITVESDRLAQSLTVMVPKFAELAAATRNTVLEGEKTRALFSGLAGAGQAVGLATEATGRAMTGLIQIISQQAIQLDEFRNQFASQIPGAMRETARALQQMGVTTTGSIGEMLRLIEKQKLSVEDLVEAVTRGLREIQRTAPDMSQSAEAAFNRFHNAVFQLKAGLAQAGLLDFLKNSTDYLREWVFWAGRALNLRPPTGLAELGQLQQQLSELRESQRFLQQQAAGEARLGVADVTRGELERVTQEIAAVEGKIKSLDATMRTSRQAAVEADKARMQRLQEEAAALKAWDAQQKAKEEAQKGEKGRLRELMQIEGERRRLQEQGTAMALKGAEEELKALERLHEMEEDAQHKAFQQAVALTDERRREVEKIEQQATDDLIRQLDRQHEAWRDLGLDIERTLADTILASIKDIGSLWDNVLDFMLASFSRFAAALIARPIVMPIVASFLGGLGGAMGGGASEILSQALGIPTTLMGAANTVGTLGGIASLGGIFGQGISYLNQGLRSVFNFLSTPIGHFLGMTEVVPGSGFPGAIQGVGGSVGSVLAGLGGVGGGIYAALTASGLGGQLGSAFGAAGGAASLAASLAPLLGASLAPVLGPIGLAVAALAPLLGRLIGSLTGARKGPRLAIGELGGLGLEVEGGQLALAGQLTS